MVTDETERLVTEALEEFGARALRFGRARPANAKRLSKAQVSALRRLCGMRIRRVANALLYADEFRFDSCAQQSANASLLKAGLVRVYSCEGCYELVAAPKKAAASACKRLQAPASADTSALESRVAKLEAQVDLLVRMVQTETPRGHTL